MSRGMWRGTWILSRIRRGCDGCKSPRRRAVCLGAAWAVLFGLWILTAVAARAADDNAPPAGPPPVSEFAGSTSEDPVGTGEAPGSWTFISPTGETIRLGAGAEESVSFPPVPSLNPVPGQPGAVGSQLPDLRLPSLDGNGLDLSVYRGVPLVVNFFASWCGPCREEAPVLRDLQADAESQGFAVVGIAMMDDPASTRRFMEEEGLDFPVGIDRDGAIARSLQVFGPPTTLFVDGEGIIRYRVLGTLREEAAREGIARAAGHAAASAGAFGQAAAVPVSGTGLWGLAVAAGAGLLSFLSPCVLPLLPVYLGYVTGMSVRELKGGAVTRQRRQVLARTLAFALGLMAVFTALGASASLIGTWLAEYRSLLTRVAGALVIVFGLHVTGLLPVSFLDREYRPGMGWVKGSGGGLTKPLLMGAAFALGWTPCVGPMLGAILALASQEQTLAQGVLLLVAYGAGLAVPFVIVGLAVDKLLTRLQGLSARLRTLTAVSGALLILLGVLMVTDQVVWLSVWFNRFL